MLTQNSKGLQQQVYTVLYDSSDRSHFHDPVPPRFLLIDREGRTVFGVGGYVKGIAEYDFDGAIDNPGFDVASVDIPKNPAFRNQFQANMNHTNIAMTLATNTRYGVLLAYAQADFSGANYGFRLKHAYVSLHNVLAGLTRSTFQDALAGLPTIDYTGPVGSVDQRNIQLRYSRTFAGNFSFAIAAEAPSASYTTNSHCEEIHQRVPDIPAYIQYQWGGGKSHVRVSGILRNLSYRNLNESSNKFRTGWAAKLSGAINIVNRATIFYEGMYGQGCSQYIVGTQDGGYDLVYGADGKMKAPHQFAAVGGLKLVINPKLFVSGGYGFTRMYDLEGIGGNAFRRAGYGIVNAFYTPIPDLSFGLEYLHGSRTNMDHMSGSANRISAMVRYDF